MSFYCLLTFMVFNEKSAVHDELLLSLVAFQILSMSLSFNNLSMLLCVHLLVHVTWSSLSFLDVQNKAFHHIWEVLGHYFFKLSFCPFPFLLSCWGSHYVYVGILNSVPQHLRLCSFSVVLFSFCSRAGYSQLTYPQVH